MRIVISLLNFRPGRIGGAETYLRNLIPRLLEAAGSDEVMLLLHQGNRDAIEVPSANRHVLPCSERQITLARILEATTPFRAYWVERAIERLRPDVVFFPQQSVFPKRTCCPALLGVLDLQHLELPQYHSWGERLFRMGIYEYSIRHARRIITISESTRRAVLKYYGVAAESTSVALLGSDSPDLSAVDEVQGLPEEYWYYPAITRPHKNHLALLRTWAYLRNRGDVCEKLVFSGERTKYWQRVKREISRLGLEDTVTHLGFLTRRQVNVVYAKAAGVLFPSIFEGFGLPVLEAVAWGKRVVASPLEVYVELGLPGECQVDFCEPEAVLRAMRTRDALCLTKPPPTWMDCARATLAAMRETAGEMPPFTQERVGG